MKRNKPMQNQYLTAKDVRQMFGGISHTSLHRWLKNEERKFPKPVYIGSRRYFKIDEIEEFRKSVDDGNSGAPVTPKFDK